MRHHALCFGHYLFSFHVLASSGHCFGLQQASWDIFIYDFGSKTRNHLQILIKKPGRLVHHPARRQNP